MLPVYSYKTYYQKNMKLLTFYKKILLALFFVLLVPSAVFASQTNGTIISGGSAGYAWSNQTGWVNFGIVNGNIHITDNGITGYAWSSNYGWVNMSPTNGGVHVAPNGSLSGYAWGQGLGWVNFSGVSITSTGKFSGQATGTTIGTLTFSCTNCNVATDYRPKDFRTNTTSTQTSPGSISPVLSSVTTPVTTTPAVTTPEPTTLPPKTSIQKRNGYSENQTRTSQSIATTKLDKTFGIRLLLEKTTVPNIKKLVANVTFDNSHTPVSMTFYIINSEGNVTWTKNASTTTQTNLTYTERFLSAPEMPAGSYMIKLYAKYNNGSRKLLAERFTITSQPLSKLTNWYYWLIDGAGFLLLISLLFFARKYLRH